MTARPIVLVDPHFRRWTRYFSRDRERLDGQSTWRGGETNRCQPNDARAASPRPTRSSAPAGGRGGTNRSPVDPRRLRCLPGWPGLRQLLQPRSPGAVGGPRVAPQVAEMALGMALAVGRESVAGDTAMRAGSEKGCTPETPRRSSSSIDGRDHRLRRHRPVTAIIADTVPMLAVGLDLAQRRLPP